MASGFLEKLEELCVEYEADFFYTTDDDGIHVTLSGVEVYAGCIDHTTPLAAKIPTEAEGA